MPVTRTLANQSLSGAELRRLVDERVGDPVVARLVEEVRTLRDDLLNERRRLAELVVDVSPEASARIREDAQRIELEVYSGYRATG